MVKKATNEELIMYNAGPFGFSEAGRKFMYEEMIPRMEALGIKVLDPWVLTPEEDINPILAMPYGEEQRNAWREMNPRIGQNNAEAIEESHGLVATLDGTDVDSGTASEVGYGAALGKPTLGYRGDFRLSADNVGSTVNLQVEYFINLHGGKIITEIDQLQPALKEMFPQLR